MGLGAGGCSPTSPPPACHTATCLPPDAAAAAFLTLLPPLLLLLRLLSSSSSSPARLPFAVARVNHLGEDYISALALGVFNVTIPTRAVMPELHFLREVGRRGCG